MQVGPRCFVVGAVAVAMTFGISASAQDDPCVSGGMISSIGMVYGVAGSKNPVPFSGTVKTSFEQKLADGNAIHTVRRSHQARDSSGRTMTEMPGGCATGDDGQMHEIVNINVNDPVARTHMNWQVGNHIQPKVVHVDHYPEQPVRRPDPDPAELERRQKMMQAARLKQQQQQSMSSHGEPWDQGLQRLPRRRDAHHANDSGRERGQRSAVAGDQ